MTKSLTIMSTAIWEIGTGRAKISLENESYFQNCIEYLAQCGALAHSYGFYLILTATQ